jgi:hypothetical protein
MIDRSARRHRRRDRFVSPKPDELPFEFTRGEYPYRVELRQRGDAGTEARQ